MVHMSDNHELLEELIVTIQNQHYLHENDQGNLVSFD